MFVEDLGNDFFLLLEGKHVLMFVNQDNDAICACKMIQTVFRADNTLYSLVPVEGVQDLVGAYSSYSEQVKYVLLINCGATVDLIEILQPEADVLFYVIDTHRPFDVCNIYSSEQIRLVGKAEDNENIPAFEDIFMDSESEDEDVEGDETAEEHINKRRERRLWQEKRNRTLFEYYQFSYHGRPSAMIVFETLFKMGRDSLECLWWAIVGVTNQLLMGYIVEHQYFSDLQILQLHLARLATADQSAVSNSAEKYRVNSQKDLNLVLYRHWNIQASFRHTMNVAVKLKLWSLRGEKNMNKLLADMGLPLSESKQNFSSMDSTLRGELFSMIESVANSYDLDDLIYNSFTLSLGFRHCYQAADFVHGMMAILSCVANGKTSAERFLECLDCLSKNKVKLLESGIDKSKKLFYSVVRLVQGLIGMKQIISAGPFLYFVLNEGVSEVKMYSSPTSLSLLARYALCAFNTYTRSRKLAALPIVASAPSGNDECIVLGLPPTSEIIPRNFFGKAFEQAAEMIGITPITTYFQYSAIKVLVKDRPKFFDALAAILS